MKTPRRSGAAAAALLVAALLAASCASRPPAADWEVAAHDGLQRAARAYLRGEARVEAQEFDDARRELSRTGQPALLARAELMRCAPRVASLVFDACAGFDRWRDDAGDAERAYAAFLAGRVTAADVPRLPAQHRPAATLLVSGGLVPAGSAAPASPTLPSEPLSRLLAAAVLLQGGHGDRALIVTAVDTASAQGWRRPLLAWLHALANLDERRGDATAAAASRRRIVLVEEGLAPAATGL